MRTIAAGPSRREKRRGPYDGIGGRHFELLDAAYVLEPRPDGTVVLHLTSTHRVSTHFNEYGGVWTELILRDLQGYLLRIVQDRAEAAPRR